VDRHVCILPLEHDSMDSLRSDVFSRVVYGSRISVGIAFLVGLPVGLISGYFRGFWDGPGEPSWGSMLYQAQSYLTSAWWMAFFPGMAIFFAVLGFNLLGDGVREALGPRTYE
jgi:peptide/nickel transport system permease protein